MSFDKKGVANLEPLIKFLKLALEDLEKQDYECVKEDIKQSLGRARNLKIQATKRKMNIQKGMTFSDLQRRKQ